MKQEIALSLAESGAIKFGSFTLKSGKKSPYFINLGALSSGKLCLDAGRWLAHSIRHLDFDSVFGPAYKGIPLAVSASIALYEIHGMDKGWLFNRKEKKTHGDMGVLVGRGSRVVIVDDVISTGKTKQDSINLLESLGITPVAIAFIVDRQERTESGTLASEELERTLNIPVISCITSKEIFSILKNRKINGKVLVDDEIYERLLGYLGI